MRVLLRRTVRLAGAAAAVGLCSLLLVGIAAAASASKIPNACHAVAVGQLKTIFHVSKTPSERYIASSNTCYFDLGTLASGYRLVLQVSIGPPAANETFTPPSAPSGPLEKLPSLSAGAFVLSGSGGTNLYYRETNTGWVTLTIDANVPGEVLAYARLLHKVAP